MTPTDDLRLTLRMNLNEVIPPGGSDTDTLFLDAEIDNLLTQSQSIEEASWRGWVIKGMRLAMDAMSSTGGGLVSAQMGAEQFKWAEASITDLFDLCKQMAQYWWDRIPAGMAPSLGGGGARILTIATVPIPGVNAPSAVPSDPQDPWIGYGDSPWWPGDMSRLLSYIKQHGWQWQAAEQYVATIPE